MADVLYLLLTVAAFGGFLLLVRGCAAVVGDEIVDAVAGDADVGDQVVADRVAAHRGGDDR